MNWCLADSWHSWGGMEWEKGEVFEGRGGYDRLEMAVAESETIFNLLEVQKGNDLRQILLEKYEGRFR